MIRALTAPNTLLSLIHRFLEYHDVNLDKIKRYIGEASTTQLTAAFGYMSNWLSNNINSNSDPERVSQLLAIFQLLGLITLKVPPVVLLNGVFDLNSDVRQPHWLLREFYEPIDIRMKKIRSYIKQFPIYGQIIPQPISFHTKQEETAQKYSELLVELEIDPSYQVSSLIYFKKLLLGHAPLDAFKKMLEHRNARSTLTRAIIDLLQDLNSTHEASQEDLIFAFSSIFLYIHAFTLNNEIDGQMLCEFLQSRPFLSPFCILAMINSIPVNLYLYNLLMPSHVIKEESESSYIMVDLSNTSYFNSFIAKMPKILNNYFSSTFQATEDVDNFTKSDDSEFLTYIHLSDTTLYNKMKSVLSVARDRTLGPLHVSAMGILLLRCISFSLQRTLLDCAETKMFTPKFCDFIKSVFSALCPTLSEQFASKFLDPNCAPKLADLTIKGIITHLMPVILHLKNNNQLIAFCFKFVNDPMVQSSSRIMIGKLLLCDFPKITPVVTKLIETTNDIGFLLEYLEAFMSTGNVNSFDDYNFMMREKEKILQKLPISVRLSQAKTLIITNIRPDRNSDSYSSLLSIIRDLDAQSISKDTISRLMKKNDPYLVLRFLTSLELFNRPDVTATLSKIITQMLTQLDYTENGQYQFEIRRSVIALPIAQHILGTLLINKYDQAAVVMFHAMEAPLLEDGSPLHWISSFCVKFRAYLTTDMTHILEAFVASLPYAEEYFVRGQDIFFNISTLLTKKDYILIQNPNIIIREYQSPYIHAHSFAKCSVGLSKLSTFEIANGLASPVFEMNRIWHRRDSACLAMAQLASSMDCEISIAYFKVMLNCSPCEMATLAGRLFLMNCQIFIFKEVCETVRALINGNEAKLEQFMMMFMPNFFRLSGNENTATEVLCGLLESVNETTSRKVQESVIDSVGLVYIRLKLVNARKSIISSSNQFNPDLREIIASSLDVDFTNNFD